MTGELAGWLGTLFLAGCMSPELAYTLKTKRVNMRVSTLTLWFFGLLGTMLHVIIDIGYDWQLLLNLSFNLTVALILLYYSWRNYGLRTRD